MWETLRAIAALALMTAQARAQGPVDDGPVTRAIRRAVEAVVLALIRFHAPTQPPFDKTRVLADLEPLTQP
jgi:hypothetical protein